MYNINLYLLPCSAGCLICLQRAFLQFSSFLHLGRFSFHSIHAALRVNDSCITQCTFKVVSQFSLTLSLGHLFLVSHISAPKWQSDKIKENCETNLKVQCVIQLSLNYKVFRWHPQISCYSQLVQAIICQSSNHHSRQQYINYHCKNNLFYCCFVFM